MKVVKHSAFVCNGSDGEFKPLRHKSSNNFQRVLEFVVDMNRQYRSW
mgnify:CR=1 FL=1